MTHQQSLKTSTVVSGLFSEYLDELVDGKGDVANL